MPKKSKKNKPVDKRKIIVFVLVFIILLTMGLCISLKMQRYNAAATQAEMVSIRELILNAAEGLKSDAPIDPKTGDAYFPQAKLYLPTTADTPQFIYSYGQEYGENDLSISTHDVLSRTSVKLYSVMNLQELFAAVPKLQSCQRGIVLSYEKINADEFGTELKQTIKLNNGKDAYMYLEKDCPELSETLELLKNIKAY